LEKFLFLIEEYLAGKRFPLTLKITDPSGNSYVKNPSAPKVDKNIQISYVQRTLE